VTAPGSASTTYAYDNVGNVTSRTDPNTHQTTYTYDTANRLTAATNPLNKTWSLSYDANGNRTQLTKPSTGTITITYDALNRPTALAFSDSTPGVSYSYDANSNRTQMVDGAGTQTYTYDTLNRLTAVARGSDSFSYSYDDAGNVTLRTYPDATSISYSYDDDSRTSAVTRNGNSANYTYNPAGAPTQITLPNSYVETRIYDAAGRVTQVKHSQGASVLTQFDYAYDADSNPTSVTDLSGVETYGYDNRDRLTSVCYQASCPGGSDPFIRWTYDGVGNRLTEARPTGTTNYSYDAADELTQAGSSTYTYDANGNETASGTRSFGWNIAGQLVSTTSSGSTTNYSYDGDGNRLQAAGAATTNYLWDINAALPRLAAERSGAGSSLRSYAYGNEGPLSMAAGGADYYFQRDALGSVRNVTSSSGQTEWTYSYEPFGTARTETKNDPMAPDNTARFAGELLDSSSSLYDLRARQYDAATGRFLSLDPRPANASNAAESSYAYALNNPAAYIDPSGLGAVWIRDRLRSLVDNFCSSSAVIPLTFAIAGAVLSPVILGYWLLGYLSTCTNLIQRFAAGFAARVTDVEWWKNLGAAIYATNETISVATGAVLIAYGCSFATETVIGAVAVAVPCTTAEVGASSGTYLVGRFAVQHWRRVFKNR
jgi:RHS repeat-associated protein